MRRAALPGLLLLAATAAGAAPARAQHVVGPADMNKLTLEALTRPPQPVYRPHPHRTRVAWRHAGPRVVAHHGRARPHRED